MTIRGIAARPVTHDLIQQRRTGRVLVGRLRVLDYLEHQRTFPNQRTNAGPDQSSVTRRSSSYSSVRRLEADGDITWYWGDESQGGRRKYFRITEKGRATYARNKSNWEYAKRVLDTVL